MFHQYPFSAMLYFLCLPRVSRGLPLSAPLSVCPRNVAKILWQRSLGLAFPSAAAEGAGKARQVKNNEYAPLWLESPPKIRKKIRSQAPNPSNSMAVASECECGCGCGCDYACGCDCGCDCACGDRGGGAAAAAVGLVIGAHIGKREHFIFKRFKNTIIIEFAA